MGEEKKNEILFVIAYVFGLITGIIVYIMSNEEPDPAKKSRLKMHGLQALILFIILIIVSIIFSVAAFIPFIHWMVYIGDVINVLIWLYGMYVGYKAYLGTDLKVPMVTEFVRKHTGYPQNAPPPK